jgi:hypothetical protein
MKLKPIPRKPLAQDAENPLGISNCHFAPKLFPCSHEFSKRGASAFAYFNALSEAWDFV